MPTPTPASTPVSTMHAPSPSHILRVHAVYVTIVSFSADNERLYSGDASGNVVVTSTRTLRSIAAWKAHSDGILGVQEWVSNVVTHGRDNKLHVWVRVVALPSVGSAASSPDLPTPELRYSLDVNALNFCRFSFLPHRAPSAISSSLTSETALIAVPNLIESSVADVWELPSCSRLHASIGKAEAPEIGMKSWQIDSDGRGNAKTGILMALHLFMKSDQLHLLSAYESGEVALRRCTSGIYDKTIEGHGWECLWKTRQHTESVMAMTVALDGSFALTVSADPIVARYDLDASITGEDRFQKHRIKQPGNGAIALHSDGRVCAIGGWNGKIRLFSTKRFKPLGNLEYHTKSCQALTFANFHPQPASGEISSQDDAFDDEDEMTEDEKEARSRWLVSGSQDHRLAIWELVDFHRDRR